MSNFWEIVNRVIEKSDILIEVLDARFPELTRNLELEEKVERAGKKLILVLNKSDLVSKAFCEKVRRKLKNCIFVSTKEHHGTKVLRGTIYKLGNKQQIFVGVVGYPNVGKSSVINLLKGKASARTSSVSGFTKGVQNVKATNRIMMIDTPGVIPFNENDPLKHLLIGTISYERVKDPEGTALLLIEALQGKVEQHFQVTGVDECEVLENIAKKRNKLLKGGIPDIYAAGRIVLQAWQKGEIRI